VEVEVAVDGQAAVHDEVVELEGFAVAHHVVVEKRPGLHELVGELAQLFDARLVALERPPLNCDRACHAGTVLADERGWGGNDEPAGRMKFSLGRRPSARCDAPSRIIADSATPTRKASTRQYRGR
jgi:hypothetical protein